MPVTAPVLKIQALYSELPSVSKVWVTNSSSIARSQWLVITAEQGEFGRVILAYTNDVSFSATIATIRSQLGGGWTLADSHEPTPREVVRYRLREVAQLAA